MLCSQLTHFSCDDFGDGGGRLSSVMSLGMASVGSHSHGHPASPICVGSLWEDTDPRSPEPLVVRWGWLWLIWVVLSYLPVKVSPHRTLNSSKFVIECEELDKMDEEEIKKKNFNHKESLLSKRISIRYSLYVLTIKGQNIPKKINIGYLKKETRPYIPKPQKCFQCQKFGHTKNSCKGKAVCAGCGEGQNKDGCQNDPKCVNYQGDHVAISRDCPKWKIEKDIVPLKYTEKIAFADARTRLQPSFDPSKDSYATVTQTPPQSSKPLPPWARKIRLPIDFKTEIEYLRYILNYCLTRLDTLDEITSENPVPRNAPSDETPPPPQTTPEQTNETTIPSTGSALQSAASNDDENEIEMLTMSNKRTFNEDSSEEDTANPLPAKTAAASSPATCAKREGRGRST